MHFLKPHTKKWFAAFARLNPWQAALTMELLQTAGTDHVCSFCGAKPARDYRLTKAESANKAPDIFRLCVSCVKVRKKSFREKVLSFAKHRARQAMPAFLTRRAQNATVSEVNHRVVGPIPQDATLGCP
jgi:hypothetical protein